MEFNFHLAPEVAWVWLRLSAKPNSAFSRERFFLLSDPSWAIWAARHTRGIPKKSGFFQQLVTNQSRSARIDFVARCLRAQTSKGQNKLAPKQRQLLDQIGKKSRQVARLIPELDSDFFNLCCSLVTLPGLVWKGKKIPLSFKPIEFLDYPFWACQLAEAFYSRSSFGKYCRTKQKIWHGLRVVFANTKDLPVVFPSISSKDLERSCQYLGIPPRKVQRQTAEKKTPAKSPLTPFKGAARQGWDHLKVAFEFWLGQQTRSGQGVGSQTGNVFKSQVFETEPIRVPEPVDLEKIRSEIIAELAGGAGHEINNPLAILLGRAQSLIKDQAFFFTEKAKEEGVRRLASITEQGKRIHVMIRKLARIGRPAPGNPVPVSVNEELQKWLAPWRERAVVQGVDFVCGKPEIPNLRFWGLADPAYLKEALEELLDNAFAQVVGGDWIGIEIRKIGNCCAIDVSNSGPPISAEVSRLLFNPFYSNRKAGRYSGLGLPLAKSLMQASGGELILHSLGGARPVCFRIQVPISAGQPISPNVSRVDGFKAA